MIDIFAPIRGIFSLILFKYVPIIGIFIFLGKNYAPLYFLFPALLVWPDGSFIDQLTPMTGAL